MPSLFIRSPFDAAASATPANYDITTPADDPFAIDVAVDGTVPGRLQLVPVFPGTLTFKPAAGAPIPADPSAAGAPPIPGSLYLVLSAQAIKELSKEVPGYGYRLVVAYKNVIVSHAFFVDTVLKAL